MRQQFPFAFIIVLLIAINVSLLIQFRQQSVEMEKEQGKLEFEKEEISSDYRLLQHAWATAYTPATSAQLKEVLPKGKDSGFFAIRLTEHQCSSCIDYTLVQVSAFLDSMDAFEVIILFTARNEKEIKQNFRGKLMQNARFIRVPEHCEVSQLDKLDIPYLLVLDSMGNVQSSYLSYPASKDYIGLYMRHMVNTINKSNEK